MNTSDFIKENCVGRMCTHFDYRYGCSAYCGEECDEAFEHPIRNGKSMVERIEDYCSKRELKRIKGDCK